ERCSFVDNLAETIGALYCTGTVVQDCMFVRNDELPASNWSVEIKSSTLAGCTLVGNGGGLSLDATSSVTTTIIAFNHGAACSGSGSFHCCDFFGNSEGNALCGTDGGGDFSVDPLFCGVDPARTENVFLQQGSPCAPGHHPAGAEFCQ